MIGATTNTYAWDRLGAGGLGTVVGDGQAEYAFGPAGLQQRTVGAASQYAQGDGLGSVRLITDGVGNGAGGATFEPWGAPRSGEREPGGLRLHRGADRCRDRLRVSAGQTLRPEQPEPVRLDA